MCDPVTIGLAASALIGAGTAAYTADQSRKTQHQAQDQAKATALTTDAAAANATNRANARGPDSAAMLSANMMAGQNGQASTMLTGPQGVDPSQLTLGRTSLLGGGP